MKILDFKSLPSFTICLALLAYITARIFLVPISDDEYITVDLHASQSFRSVIITGQPDLTWAPNNHILACWQGNQSRLQARKFFQDVIDKSDHYSKFGAMPKGLCLGSAKECMLGTGDCCTDQHALLSRSAGRVAFPAA